MTAIGLPSIGTVLVTALVDSINPCAIGVLILLVSTLLALGKNKSKILSVGLIYIAAVYTTYFLAGLGLTAFFHTIPITVAEYISIIVGSVIVVAGLIEIKDFFWYGQGISLSIPANKVKTIEKLARKITIPGIIFLGVFVAAVELPCTGGPYLAITLILSRAFSLQAVYLLLIYNFIFVLPLIIILALVYFGKKIQVIKKWKQKNRTWMRLAIGIILILLGWMLILMANGTINLN